MLLSIVGDEVSCAKVECLANSPMTKGLPLESKATRSPVAPPSADFPNGRTQRAMPPVLYLARKPLSVSASSVMVIESNCDVP